MPSNFFNFFKNEEDSGVSDEGRLVMLDVKNITPNRNQPRKFFKNDKIDELAKSIEENGLLQPIVVREYEPQKYEIVAGERRFRAVQILKWEKIQAIVRKYDQTASAIQALNENLQRENLSPIEEAVAYQSLIELTNGTQQSIARQLGKSQGTIANKLRLLKLDSKVQKMIINGDISERHGRELLRLPATEQVNIANTIKEKKLNVKEAKILVDEKLNFEPKKLAEKKQKRKFKPQAKILNKMDSLVLAIQTLKQSLNVIEENGINVIQNVKQIDSDQVEITIQLKKITENLKESDLSQDNGGN